MLLREPSKASIMMKTYLGSKLYEQVRLESVFGQQLYKAWEEKVHLRNRYMLSSPLFSWKWCNSYYEAKENILKSMCTRLSNLRTTGNFKIEKKCYEGIRERGSHAKMAGSEVIHASLAG